MCIARNVSIFIIRGFFFRILFIHLSFVRLLPFPRFLLLQYLYSIFFYNSLYTFLFSSSSFSSTSSSSPIPALDFFFYNSFYTFPFFQISKFTGLLYCVICKWFPLLLNRTLIPDITVPVPLTDVRAFKLQSTF